MSELKDVQPGKFFVTIGGEERELRYTYSAWAILEEKFEDLDRVMNLLQSKPIAHLPILLYAGLRKREGVTEDLIREWLDDLDSVAALYGVLGVMTSAMTSTLPNEKKKAGATPPKPEGQ
jgi:hypothetical protein